MRTRRLIVRRMPISIMDHAFLSIRIIDAATLVQYKQLKTNNQLKLMEGYRLQTILHVCGNYMKEMKGIKYLTEIKS